MVELSVAPKLHLFDGVVIRIQHSVHSAALRSKDVSVESKAVRGTALVLRITTSWKLGSEPKHWVEVV